MLLIALATGLAAPVPLNPGWWLSGAVDIPQQGLTSGELTVIAVELTVGPGGGAIKCAGSAARGNPNMAPYTCQRVMRGALFRPARDAEGRKTYGVYRMSIGWWNSVKPPPPLEVAHNFEFQTNRLPSAASSPVNVPIKFSVDEAGHLGACEANEAKTADLAAVGCAELSRVTALPPATDWKGKAVSSVQNAIVELYRSK